MHRIVSALSICFVAAIPLSGAMADEGKLRLNFDNAPTLTAEPSGPDITLDELLSVSPRTEGLKMSLETQPDGPAESPLFGLGYGDQAYGLSYELFTSFAGRSANRFGLSGLNTGGVGRGITLNSDLSLGPRADDDGRLWQVGGKLGYGGFEFGADFARESSLTDQAEYRDYRLGLSYAGDSWRVGMQYMRSLQDGGQDNLLGVADAIEFGGVWSVSNSVYLVGGVQFWDQQELSITDGQSRDALIFLGTRIQF